jgi:predicted RNA binding protein YcfA (HicA-like mRNA interferase family)
MKTSFGSKDLIKCLKCLGFIESKQSGSSHQKFKSPKGKQVGKRSFIIVIKGRKNYDPNTRSSYIRQIKEFGFSDNNIFDCFNLKQELRSLKLPTLLFA